MISLPFKLPLFARMIYWSGFAYLTKLGKLKSGKREEHNFHPSFGTYLFRKGEELLLEHCKNFLPEHTQDMDIPVREVDVEEISQDLMRETRFRQLPLVIKRGARDWKAMDLSLELFSERYGNIEVPAHSEPNKIFEDNGKPVPLSNFYQMSYVKVKDLIKSVKENGKYSAKAIEDLMHVNNGELIKEFCNINHIHYLSDYERHQNEWSFFKTPVGRVISEQIFIQPSRSHTLWHAEPGDNYFVAVKGVKKWRLVSPYYSAGMYPVIKDSSVYHVSKVDGRESNEIICNRGFPLYNYIPKFSATVEPSDILFFPNYWWHTVTNVPDSYSISLTFRTISETNKAAPMLWVLNRTDPSARAIRKKVLKHGRLFDEDIAATLYEFADPKNNLIKNKK